jgi:hypothetical protein
MSLSFVAIGLGSGLKTLHWRTLDQVLEARVSSQLTKERPRTKALNQERTVGQELRD